MTSSTITSYQPETFKIITSTQIHNRANGIWSANFLIELTKPPCFQDDKIKDTYIRQLLSEIAFKTESEYKKSENPDTDKLYIVIKLPHQSDIFYTTGFTCHFIIEEQVQQITIPTTTCWYSQLEVKAFNQVPHRGVGRRTIHVNTKEHHYPLNAGALPNLVNVMNQI